MSYLSWKRAVKSVKPLEVLEEAAGTEIKAKLVAAGMGNMTSSGRIANQDPPLSNAQFVTKIQDTFKVKNIVDGKYELPQVTIFKPLEGPNKSHSFSMFMFNYDGKADNYITLAGGTKGRGTKQTDEQETSWLLVLSAFYHTSDMQTVDASKLFEICQNPDVYSRVYGNDGKALDEGKAIGLVKWMEKNGGIPFDKPPSGWVNSHISQAKAFIKKFGSTNIPSRFVKDNSKIPIVKLAKQIFPTSVPDQTFDKDKWNPADVWIEFSDYILPVVDKNSDYKLTDLNNYLLDSITGGKGVIGVSLKLGTGTVNSINMTERPEYNVTDFKMQFGDFFAQNVSSKYAGNELEGYSVTYRLFDAKATSLIRGEAQKTKTLAAHGKVFLAYIDFLLGLYGKKGVSAVRTIAGVKGELIKEKTGTDSGWELTKQGKKAFRIIKRVWPTLRDDSGLIKGGRDYKVAEYDVLTDEAKFLNAVGEYARKNKTPEKNMQTRISARFQTIRLGALFSAIKSKDVNVLHKLALGMLLYGKSESTWSAPHTKAT